MIEASTNRTETKTIGEMISSTGLIITNVPAQRTVMINSINSALYFINNYQELDSNLEANNRNLSLSVDRFSNHHGLLPEVQGKPVCR